MNGPQSRWKRSRRSRRAAALPDTLDPVEIALQAANDGTMLVDPAHALIVSQNHLIRLQIGTERIAIGLKLLLGVAGLVVDSFQVPPSLAQRGLTGEVVAGKIIDRLTDKRANTETSRASDVLESGLAQGLSGGDRSERLCVAGWAATPMSEAKSI